MLSHFDPERNGQWTARRIHRIGISISRIMHFRQYKNLSDMLTALSEIGVAQCRRQRLSRYALAGNSSVSFER